jgi:hypothetical protein
VHTLFCFEFLSLSSYWFILLGFLQNSFEKRQIAACCSSKEFFANPGNVSTNRKMAIALSCLQKSFVNSKNFSVFNSK